MTYRLLPYIISYTNLWLMWACEITHMSYISIHINGMKWSAVAKRMTIMAYSRHHDLCDGLSSPNYKKTIKKRTKKPSDNKISWTIIAVFITQDDVLRITTRETIRFFAARRRFLEILDKIVNHIDNAITRVVTMEEKQVR